MTHKNRRQFIQNTAVVTSALTATVAHANHFSPNDRLQVAFVGVAGRAGALLNMFSKNADVDIVALADIDSGRLASAKEKVKSRSKREPKTASDFRKFIDDPSIDVFVVGTPDHWHAIPTIMACLEGKDVYVEKPDGHNMLEGQRMVQAMRKKQRIVQMGTQARTNPQVQKALNFIRSGKLGRVLVAKAWESAKQGPIGYPDDQPVPRGVDYNMWLGPAPERPFNPRRFHGSWRWFFDYGTGDLGNDGVHRIDLARWALEVAVETETGVKMSALPKRISALGGKWYFDDAQEWPDTLQVNYEYDVSGHAGRILTYEMRVWTPYRYMDESEGVVLFGDEGYMVLGNTRWRAFAPNGKVIAEASGGNNGERHVRNFLDCVHSRKRPAADLETVGHPSSVMCHAGNVAWKTGKQLALDPKTELFDDEKANELRSREYRKSFELPFVS